MKRAIILFTLLIFFRGAGIAQEEKTFTIYLVRHAEKLIDKNNLSDPPLTECGRERAKSIERFLSDIDIERIYSTNYVRTMSTASPTALSRDLDIEIYDPRDLQSMAQKLIERGEDALVVGHSNTTYILAGLLAGEPGFAIADNVYNQIYQVVICASEKQLNIFYTAFECTEDRGISKDK